MALTTQQQAFVSAYLRTFNATKAALEAKYSEKTAYSQGSRLLKNAEIAAVIRARMEADAMSASEVLFHLAQIARGDFDDISDNSGNLDMMEARRIGKTNLIKRVKNKAVVTEESDISESEVEMYDRLRALELIGKHLKMWTDKVQVDDWRLQAIEDIRAGNIDYDALAEAFDRDLASELFTAAGKTVQVSEGESQ
ncbi:MAG: terminase small subunit [Anaerolineae bacterium]